MSKKGESREERTPHIPLYVHILHCELDLLHAKHYNMIAIHVCYRLYRVVAHAAGRETIPSMAFILKKNKVEGKNKKIPF